MPPASPEHPQSFASGRYRVRRLLGEGGMGLVYQAHDDNLDCEVVIKTPRRGLLDEPGFADRFAREIRSLVTLAHPHVVKIIDVGRQDGLPFAVMQYLEGGSLADRPTPATAASLKSWLLSVAQALDFVHQQGLLHRDVKPANILFDAHGNAFLGDFGVARVLSAAEPARDRARLTGLGLVLGTPEYLAPELVMGKPEPDGRADQYALAATVYHVLAGRPPFDGATPTAVMVRHTTEAVPPLRDLAPAVPSGLAAAVEKGLSKEPKGRHQNCVAFVRAALTGNVAPTRPAPAMPRPTPARPAVAPTRIEAAPEAEKPTPWWPTVDPTRIEAEKPSPPRPPVAPTRIVADKDIAPPTPRRSVAATRIEAAPQVPTPSSLFRQPAKPEMDPVEEPPPGLPRRVRIGIAAGVFAALCCVTVVVVAFRHSTPKVQNSVQSSQPPIAGDNPPPPPRKFVPFKAAMTMERPIAGVPATIRVVLDFPSDAPRFPLEKLHFTLDGKDFPANLRGDGVFPVTLPKPGPQKLLAQYTGGDYFEKVSIPLEVNVLTPLPKFTVEATPSVARPGEKIEVRVKGLPDGFGGFGKINLIGQGDDAKATPSLDGRNLIVIEGLKLGAHSIKAKYPGDDTYASGESSNAVEIRVGRKAVFAFEQMLDREQFSRGKLDLRVTVKGSDKDDPIPQGMVRLMSAEKNIAVGNLGKEGTIAFEKSGLAPGAYDLKLHFTADDREWSMTEERLKGTWQVVPTAEVGMDLSESNSTKASADKVKFIAAKGDWKIEVPATEKKYFLQFRPSKQSFTGTFEQKNLPLPFNQGWLWVRWNPDKNSWGASNPLSDVPSFHVLSVDVSGGKLNYRINNTFPPVRKNYYAAYVPLVPAFRKVMQSLDGAEIEIYEGTETKVKVKSASGADVERKVCVKKDPDALPMLRLKIVDK